MVGIIYVLFFAGLSFCISGDDITSFGLGGLSLVLWFENKFGKKQFAKN